MIKNNKHLETDWDALYMQFNEEFDVDWFEPDCADEIPLMQSLIEMKDDKNGFENIFYFFYSNYHAIYHNNIDGSTETVIEESPEYYEGYAEYKRLILLLALYCKLN